MGMGRRSRVSKWGSPPCRESGQKTMGMGVIFLCLILCAILCLPPGPPGAASVPRRLLGFQESGLFRSLVSFPNDYQGDSGSSPLSAALPLN